MEAFWWCQNMDALGWVLQVLNGDLVQFAVLKRGGLYMSNKSAGVLDGLDNGWCKVDILSPIKRLVVASLLFQCRTLSSHDVSNADT